MDGFSEGVNGFVDVEDQLRRYLLCNAAEHFSNERAEKRSIGSRGEFEARRERVREAFLSTVGGLPDRSGDPSIETTGQIERDGYSIELLRFESRPNFHVTANCYVPDGDGPHPGILFLCGHVDSPKGDPFNQKACIELALNGFVVLIVDPLGQGERTQYDDLDVEGTTVSGGGGTFPHIYAGQKCFYADANLARFVIHDYRRALDYFIGRPDVDDDRIGVTGASGGGTQTLYLSLVDDRIDAIAPCCAVSDRRDWMETGKRTHAEQTIYGQIARGINFDDLVAAAAPRPVCVGAAASDEYFPIEGVHEAVDRVRRVYGFYDAVDRVDLVVADAPHCSVYEIGNGTFEFLCEHLGDEPFEPHSEDELATPDESELLCTPEGSVREAYADERTIDDLIREYVAAEFPEGGTRPRIDDDPGYADRLRETLVEKFDLDREYPPLYPRFVERTTADGLTVEYVFFETERHPDVVVTGVLVSDPDSTADSPAVVLYERGTEDLPEKSEDVASLAREYGAVFVFDPRGVGAVRGRALSVPAWWDDYDGIYGTEFKFANDALLLETSLMAMRTYDVLRAVEFLRSETDADRVSFVGEGVGAYHALYAASVARDVDRVDLREMGPSFYELATRRKVPFYPQLTVFDVIDECDVPNLLAALDQRGVRVSGEIGSR